MEIYLIRHTAVGVAKGICYGQSDVPLAATFEEDAQQVQAKLALHLPELASAIVFSSPAQRCTRLAQALGLEPLLEPKLWEMNFGVWEMQPWSDLPASETQAWMENFVEISPPGGENFLALQQRASQFFKHLPHHEANPVVIISHAGVIRSIICETIGLPLSNAFQIELDYGSISKLIYQWGRWKVKFLNI
jgi:alpha-ribazole phosphatase